MLPFLFENLDLPIRPGDKVWWVNSDPEYIPEHGPEYDPEDHPEYSPEYEELEIEGVVLMRDRLCALIDGDILEIGRDVFLSRQEAAAWANAHRKPSLRDILETAGWHENTPPESGTCYVRYPEGDIQKVYYHDGSETGGLAGFYPYRSSYSRIRRTVSGWTRLPDIF